MKTQYIITISFLLMLSNLSAQIYKGKMMIGGSTNLMGGINQLGSGELSPNNNLGIFFGKRNVNVNGRDLGEVSTTVVNFTPTFGKMTSNNFMLGLATGFFYLSSKGENTEASRLTTISATPFVRFYTPKINKINPYIELKGGYQFFWNENTDDNNPIIGGKLALSSFLNTKVALDFFLDYTYSLGEDNKEGIFGVGIGFSLFR